MKLNLKRNAKQILFLKAVLENVADYIKDGFGAWQRGFVATFQAGRASGKTHTLFDIVACCARELPGAIFGITAKNYYQVQAVILQQMEIVLKEHNLHLYNKTTNPFGHYVIFQKPPDHWARPHFAVNDYSRTVSFCNGFALQLASADSAESLRGINWDGILCDETASYDEKFKQKLYAGVRANKGRYRDKRKGREKMKHPLHWLKCEFTSAPTRPEGNHIYKTEELAKIDPKGYYWLQATAYDNLLYLPGDYIKNLRNELTTIAFNIEVMNERLSKVSNAFYPSLNMDNNTFDSYEYIWNSETYQYDVTDTAAKANKELIVGFDFNSTFTCLLVAQQMQDEFRFVDEMFVKESDTTVIDSLVDNFIMKYANHQKKTVRIRGDHSGKKKPENAKQSSWNIVKTKLADAGWKVIDEVQKSYYEYEDRHIVANYTLRNENPQLDKIKIHKTRCKNLLISMQLCPAEGPTFEKDKSSEKNKAIPQEEATHFTDVFDYIIMPKFARFVITKKSKPSGLSISSAA